MHTGRGRVSGLDIASVTLSAHPPGAGEGGVASARPAYLTAPPRIADELSWKAMMELSATSGPLSVSLTILKSERGISTPAARNGTPTKE